MANFKSSTIFLSFCTTFFIASCKQHTAQNTDKQISTTQNSVVPKSAPDSTRLIGVWLDQDLTWQKNQRVAYEIISKGSKIYIQVITFSGKKLNVNDNPEISATATELSKNGDKYISNESPKYVYTFDKTGNMQVFDENGLIMKCKRML